MISLIYADSNVEEDEQPYVVDLISYISIEHNIADDYQYSGD